MEPKFKVGDRVRILTPSEERKPEIPQWVEEMDASIGKIGVISNNLNEKGRLYFLVKFDGGEWWYYALEDLELVTWAAPNCDISTKTAEADLNSNPETEVEKETYTMNVEVNNKVEKHVALGKCEAGDVIRFAGYTLSVASTEDAFYLVAKDPALKDQTRVVELKSGTMLIRDNSHRVVVHSSTLVVHP